MAICLVVGCRPVETKVHRGFYYWKSQFRLGSTERQTLQALQVEKLYVKFFDIVWNAETHRPQPVAKLNFQDSLPPFTALVPVVFITNETLQKCSTPALDTLAKNLVKLLASQYKTNRLKMPAEIQLDCDWSATTRDKYFALLQKLKQSVFFQGRIMSVTIRLHQIKYTASNGIPPADRGLLMCYNMGNLRNPETPNSIIDANEFEKYMGGAGAYPLPLDMALPIFSWWVWFRGNDYQGLFHEGELALQADPSKKHQFGRDTILNGYTFRAGDWLRFEDSPLEEISRVSALARKKINHKDINIILYHLDPQTLSHYALEDLEIMFNRFR